MMKWAAVALLALFCTSAYGAIDDVDGDDEPEEKPFATEITPDNYEELIDASDEYWMVEFFAPWHASISIVYHCTVVQRGPQTGA